jgi:hypothetical protein
MKAIIRRLLGPIWWASRPLRRAVMGWFDARVVRLVSSTIDERMLPPILEALEDSEARLERIERLMARADRSASTMAEEVDVVLNGLSREIFRLRAQVARLQGDDRRPVAGLSLLAEPEAEVPAAERARVG